MSIKTPLQSVINVQDPAFINSIEKMDFVSKTSKSEVKNKKQIAEEIKSLLQQIINESKNVSVKMNAQTCMSMIDRLL